MKRIAIVAALSGTFFVAALSAQRPAHAPSGRDAWIGVELQRGKDDAGNELEYPVIVAVAPDSPADSAGLIPGDTVLKFGDIDARANPFGLRLLLKPDRRIRLKLRHNGTRTVMVVARKRQEEDGMKPDVNINSATLEIAADDVSQLPALSQMLIPIAAPSAMRITMTVAGASLARMNRDLAEALHVHNRGVLVLAVAPATPAMRAGLKGGDVILKVNTTFVNTPGTLLHTISSKTAHDSADRHVALYVVRTGKERMVTLRW